MKDIGRRMEKGDVSPDLPLLQSVCETAVASPLGLQLLLGRLTGV